jgi:molybdopterin converting factor small subunit
MIKCRGSERSCSMPEPEKRTIEVRVFGSLSGIFEKKNLPVPFIMGLVEPITGTDLAKKLEIPRDAIEVIIVNGVVQALNYSIRPGDRVAFVPPRTPGPYRVLLGFIHKNKD